MRARYGIARAVRRPWVLLVVGLAAAAALVAGALAGGSDGRDRPTAGGEAPGAPPEARSPDQEASEARLVLIGGHGGISRELAARVHATAGVQAVTAARRGHALMRASVSSDGRVVDRARSGFAIPLDTVVVDARRYARIVPAAARRPFLRLRSGTAVLGRSSSRVRRVSVGGAITLVGGSRLRVVGVVDDDLLRGAELGITRADADRVEQRRSYLVASSTDPERLFRRFGQGGVRVGLLGPDRDQPSRGGIARAVELKARFGEFAVRLPYGDDWINPDPRWVRRTIVTRRVPILGRVTCHRAMFPALQRALREIVRRRLQRLVDPGDYAGCYAPRRIPGSGSLSLHAWGLAFDINASKNPQFARPRQDPRIVRILEAEGFAWGGRWPTATDGMHFEFRGTQ